MKDSNDMDTSKELAFAKELGQKAYEIAQKYYKKNPSTLIKDDNSPVTIADEEINQLVIDKVKETFPTHGVLGEEQSFGLEREYLWVCDPIDGTLAFTMGQPTFMFSLALVVEGQPIVAVVGNLSNGIIYHATKNGGSFVNDMSLSVSKRTLSKAFIYVQSNIKNLLQHRNFYLAQDDAVAQTNPVHGGVFKGVGIAEGLGDGSVWLRNVHPWDIAAIALLVEEAGGAVTDRTGSTDLDFTKDLNGIVLASKLIHADLLKIVLDYDNV